MHIPDSVVGKDLTLAELGIYVRLLLYCQKSNDNTWHGGYDTIKDELLMGVGSERKIGMEALGELYGYGLIQVTRTDGIWHITPVEVER